MGDGGGLGVVVKLSVGCVYLCLCVSCCCCIVSCCWCIWLSSS